MLAIRESDHAEEHLRIFARLARKVMHEDFRERLLTEQDKNELLRYLAGSLEL
jgi:mannitol/fructose-specific phosphotransferase system IIA component (Ntr-type)